MEDVRLTTRSNPCLRCSDDRIVAINPDGTAKLIKHRSITRAEFGLLHPSCSVLHKYVSGSGVESAMACSHDRIVATHRNCAAKFLNAHHIACLKLQFRSHALIDLLVNASLRLCKRNAYARTWNLKKSQLYGWVSCEGASQICYRGVPNLIHFNAERLEQEI